MDVLTPILSQLSLSARYFFSGHSCQTGILDGKAPVGHLHLVKSGNVQVEVGENAAFSIDCPSILFFPRPCAHKLIPGQHGVELVCASIDLGHAEGSPLALSLPDVVVLSASEVPRLSDTLAMLFYEASQSEMGRQVALDRLFEFFMIQLLRHLLAKGELLSGPMAAMTDPRLNTVINAMHEKPAHPWTLEELADVACMSRARFAANFRSSVGLTPLDYLTSWRIAVARKQLKQGRPLKNVALSVGYQSTAALSRVFAKRIGSTPSDWLQRQMDDK